MVERHAIEASIRTIQGKETKHLRRAGKLPGVVYGPVIEAPISVQVDMKELDRMYYAYGSNLLIDLTVDGSSYPVYMRHVTIDRLIRKPQHVEFYAPNMRIDMTVSVPVMLTGDAGNPDGVVTLARETIDIRGLPDALPSSFEIDISALTEIDQAIYVSELPVQEGVEVLTDGEEMIVKLNAPTLSAEVDEDAVSDEALEDAALAGGSEAADATASDEPGAEEGA